MARTKQTARKTCMGKCPRPAGIHLKTKSSLHGTAMRQEQLQIPQVVNTQQFSLNFDDQQQCQKEAIKSQIYKCSRCQACLTSQSTVLKNDEYCAKKSSELSDSEKQKFLDKHQSVWICEFCMKHNDLPKQIKVPKPDNPCLILADPKKINKGQINEDNKSLIFCIDISGSMDCNVNGKTRLEAVKQALSDQINRMKFQKEDINIGIITFGSMVSLLGDGKSFKQTTLQTSLYKNFDGICKQIQKIQNFCQPINKSYACLKKTVSSLSTYGSTALGPGLLAAVQLASKGSVGSKVILCTDGEANVGLGGSFNDDRFTFYSKMAEHAKKKRVMVNILSLKGDRCNLKQLGKLSLATGGSILKIDTTALGTQFNKIIKQNILGTQTKLTIKVNKLFRICNGTDDEISKDKSTLIQDFGNFSAQTILSFQFDTISKEEAKSIPQIDMNLYSQKRVPMQVQLEYTGRKGERYLQIITDWRQITENFDDIYDGADFQLFAISVLQRSSQKIKNAEYQAAKTILNGYWSLVSEKFSKTQNKDNLDRFGDRVKNLQRVLASKMSKNKIKFEKKEDEQGHYAFKARGRGRGASKNRKRSLSRDIEVQKYQMQSDSQEQILYQQIRARDKPKSEAVAVSSQKSSGKSHSRSRKKSKV